MKTIELNPIPKTLEFVGTLGRIRTPKRYNAKSFGDALAHSFMVATGQVKEKFYPDFVFITQDLYVKKYKDKDKTKEFNLQFNVSNRVGKCLESIPTGSKIKISCHCRAWHNGLGGDISRIKLLEVYNETSVDMEVTSGPTLEKRHT